MTIIRLVFAVVLLAATHNPAFAKSENIPVEAFAALPSFNNAKLSPNGLQLGFQSYNEGRTVLVVEDIGGKNRIIIPPLQQADISNFYWANDNRLLVIYEYTVRRHGSIVKSQQTRMVAVDRDGKNFRMIVEPEKEKETGSRFANLELPAAQFQHKVVDMLHDDPEHILLSIDGDQDGTDEIRKMNVYTGSFKRFRDDELGVQKWRKDPNGEIRYGAGYRDSRYVERIKDAQGNWIGIQRTNWGEKFDFEDFSIDPNIVFVYGNSQYGTRGIYKLALDTGQIVETVFEHPQVDADYTVLHPYSGEPIGVAYTVDQQKVQYFHKTWKKVQAIVDKSLPNTVNRIVSKARKGHIYLIEAKASNDPGVYYYLDIKGKRLEIVGSVMAHIDPETASLTTQVTIPVRDGSIIPAYLTLPENVSKPSKLATVVMPHGGPESRSTADWHYRAQFLANRGYAVLQPNFRGSTGYGIGFQSKGNHQWGGLMQDDVTDATKWLIKNKIADKKRICIIGVSYGGYAALMGTVKEPKLYKCAASINGAPNIPALKTDDKHYIGGRAWIKTMGLKGVADKEVSPHHRAEDIDASILLIASKDDARIDYKLSKSMHSKLLQLGKDSTYIELEDGGHGMDTGNSRLKSLKALEAFLAKHIGG